METGTFFEKISNEGPVSGTGRPLILFDETYKPPPKISVHDAVEKGMGKNWNFRKILQPTVDDHINYTITIKEIISLYDISNDECGAIVYYTFDALSIGGNKEDCPYFQLNSVMAKRDIKQLAIWKDFLYFFLSGLQKIPNVKERVFRALNQPISQLSKQYQVGNTVVWISFISTSKDLSIAKEFMDNKNSKGTIMSIDVIEGKDISSFSLFPEKEVLLLPNSSFEVKEITSSQMKDLVNIPSLIDGIILTQKPTPLHLLLMKPVDKKNIDIVEFQKKINELNQQWKNKLDKIENEFKNEKKKYQEIENELRKKITNLQNKLDQKNKLEIKCQEIENELRKEITNLQNKLDQKNELEKMNQEIENKIKKEKTYENKPYVGYTIPLVSTNTKSPDQEKIQTQNIKWGSDFKCMSCVSNNIITFKVVKNN